ncbi:DUF86 domain-containing protein [bacterium]|nr:MAG: DUF86 domain-containing protein [bacterium]
MKDKDRIIIDYLNDILESIINIKSFIHDMDFLTFQEDKKSQYAVIRALEIIGEASKKIPKVIQKTYSDIPWRFMSGMKDKLIHDYFGVDTQVVWNTVTEDILSLEDGIKKLVSDYSH